MQTMQINDQVSVGPQPSEEEPQKLGQQGFKTVVNFRTEGEEEQPLSPQAEGEKAKSAGMEYLHLPVSTEAMGPELEQFVRQYVDSHKAK